MTDPEPPNIIYAERYWSTSHFNGRHLYEYNSFSDFQTDRVTLEHELTEVYFGTGHIVYNGAFYYHHAGFNEIVKFDLSLSKTMLKKRIPQMAYKSKDEYVYSTEYNYIDFAADENGLWAIYGCRWNRSSLLVSKLNPENLSIEKTWNITMQHQEFGNSFIVCGILYMVRDTRTTNSYVDFAYDLYKKQTLDVKILFKNPFNQNNMVSYSHRDKQLYGWDRGNQMKYVLKF